MSLIIDCHGHYTVLPKGHDAWREEQKAAFKEGKAPPPYPEISDDEIRETIEANQLRLIKERGADFTIFSPRASAMAPHVGDQAVATSGRSSRRQLVVDPRNGAKAHHIAYATVVANHAADADALATAFSVLQPRESLKLADSLPGIAARITDRDGGVHESRRWQDYCDQSSPTVLAQADGPGWPAGFAVTVGAVGVED